MTGGAPLKVLHLLSNYKWTGPAEPALNLCVALRGRGIEADFACAPGPPRADNKITATARDRGIEPILRMHLAKHRNPWRNLRDRRALARLLEEGGYTLLHCHLDNDHRIAAAPAAARGVPLVRSSYYGTGFPSGRRGQRLVNRAAAIIEPSELARENDVRQLGAPPARLHVIPNAVDTARFDPRRQTPDGRRWLGIPPSGFVLGIVARLQTHRRYEDLFEAFRRFADAAPEARLIVVGRGTRQEQVGFEPVQRLGLQDRVHFTGFIDGEKYVGMLRAFDAGVFLFPGSDGTCRAAREMMAMANPVVTADRGMLQEIVQDGENGFVTDGTPEALCAAFRRLHASRAFRHKLGQAARATAESRYSLEAQSEAVAGLYESLL